MGKPILCLDFDGVCHSYTSGWQGASVIPDPPVPGLFEFLENAQEFFDVQIFSSRSHQPGGLEAMDKWFAEHYRVWLKGKGKNVGIALSFPEYKPSAMITLDDRGITFDGNWPDIQTLRNFKPWNKR